LISKAGQKRACNDSILNHVRGTARGGEQQIRSSLTASEITEGISNVNASAGEISNSSSRVKLRARAELTSHFHAPMHPAWLCCQTGVLTPENVNLFLREP
jgi:hypothetical protein